MELLCRIRDILRAIHDFETDFQKRHGVGLNEGMVLCGISEYGSSSSGEIAERLGLTCSNASKVIASAEKKGLIERGIGETDKRRMYFSLSKAGEDCLSRIQADPDTALAMIEKIREM